MRDDELKRLYMREYMRQRRARQRGEVYAPHRIWFAARWEHAQRLRAEGHSDEDIARALRLTPSQVRNKFMTEGYRANTRQSGAASRPSADLLNAREARLRAAERRTQTQEFFGDPPPGYSALDRKRSGAPT